MDVGLTLTAFGGMIGLFVGLAKMMLNQSSRDREADRKERREGIKASKNMARAFTKVADATERSAAEAKERNGHLGSQNKAIAQLVAQGNILTKGVLERLNIDADILETHEVSKDDAVHTVKTDLEESNAPTV